LLAESSKNEAADPTEPIDCNFFIRHEASKVAKGGRSVNERLERLGRRRSCDHRFDAKPS